MGSAGVGREMVIVMVTLQTSWFASAILPGPAFCREADVSYPVCEHWLGLQHGGEKLLDGEKGFWSDETIQKQI